MIACLKSESHHLACDCREHKIAVLVKVALDLGMELDWVKNDSALAPEAKETVQALVERAHSAIEALGYDYGPQDAEPPAELGGPGWAAVKDGVAP